ncbi:MAG: hypothetical protein DRI37_03550 [Chloroflexi bacterium]|nr:MAG: hypothetical protein DRI37_03550 [Chloroflexota bacterium]
MKSPFAGARRALALGLLLLSLFLNQGITLAQEAGPNHAGLVIVGEDGNVSTHCIAFEEEQLSGLELLQRSGLNPEFKSGGLGAALCALEGKGCPAEDCFCECKGAPCNYWGYFHLQTGGTWNYSGVGAGGWTLQSGDVDAWVWGDGKTAPPPLTFADICPADGSPSPTVETTPVLTPAAQPTVQIFIPAASAPTGSSERESPVLAVLGSRYGSFALLLLALIALAWMRRRREK